jgi:hypothetical protein
VCWVFAGIIGLLTAFLVYGQYRRMTTWTPVLGTVVQSEIYWDYSKNTKGGSSVVYGARFAIKYHHNGTESMGSADLGYRTGFKSLVERQVHMLPVGMTRKVSVNPDNPSDISLASDFGELSFAAAYLAAAFFLITAALGLALRTWSTWLNEASQRKAVMRAAG